MAAVIGAAYDTGGKDDASSARVLLPTDIVGTYDLVVTTPLDGAAPVGIGWVADGDALYVQLTVPPIALQGTLRRHGCLVLEGVTTGSDGVVPVSATGRVRAEDGVYRIELAIADTPARRPGAPAIAAPGEPIAIVMERPITADLREAHGRFRLDFVGPRASGCADPATLEITVPVDASGSAYLDAGSVVVEVDRVIAQLRFALVDVAPSGRFHLEAEYVAAEGCDPAGLIGTSAQWQADGQWPFGGPGTVTHGRYVLLSSFRTEIETHDLVITRIE